MGRYLVTDNLTPGQRRSRERAAAVNAALVRFRHESNAQAQFYEGEVVLGCFLPDGKALIQFRQYNKTYQVIIGPEKGTIFDHAKALVPLYKNRTRFHVAVKAKRGYTNEKGICNLKDITLIR